MQDEIRRACEELEKFLIEKNQAYGNSAADPVRIFSRADVLEQINVRIDDKLSRIARGSEYQGDDTELDLAGYLILKRVVRRTMAAKEQVAPPPGMTLEEMVAAARCGKVQSVESIRRENKQY